MSLRMTEEEYADLMARRKRTFKPSAPEHLQSAAAHIAYCDEIHVYGGEASAEKPKRRKYGNRRVEIDGMKFDSQHEADYYFRELMPRVKAGELKCVCRQVPFDLPGGIRYIADFVTIRPDMRIEAVIDAKSAATKLNRVYINKKKQLRALWGIEIQEV